MSPARKPALSQKTLAFLHAEVILPLHVQTPRSALERVATYLMWGVLIGFMLLIISAPMILALVIFTSINLTVVWLQLGAGLFFVGFLGFLPQLARESPWKAILLVLVVSLIGVSLYCYGYTTLPIALIQTPALIAYGLLYAWKGSDLLQAYQRQRQRLLALSLTTVLAIVCFSLAGWYILHYTVVLLPDQGNLFPLVLLISPYTFLIQMEGSRPGSRAS